MKIERAVAPAERLPETAAKPAMSQQETANAESMRPANWRILLAFAVVYIVWGSTYLAVRYAVETVPPFLICSARYFGSGLGMLFIGRMMTKERTTWTHWRNAALIGGLMFLGGNGLVFWSETFVPSGIAALVIATVPLWIIGLDTIFFRAARPRPVAWIGFALGLLGVAILVDPFGVGGNAIAPSGCLALLGACFFWSLGSLKGRTIEQPKSLFLAAAMQMLGGGTCLLVFATLIGEWSRFDPTAVSAKSIWAMVYLMVMGGMLTFSCYAWLMRVCDASVVSTYAYVNPVIAVILGCWIGREPFTSATAVGAVFIVLAVILIVSLGRKAVPPAESTG